MPRETQESRRSYTIRRAGELAMTGAFATCHAIEVSLRREGFIDAHEILDQANQRKWLNERCAQSTAAAN